MDRFSNTLNKIRAVLVANLEELHGEIHNHPFTTEERAAEFAHIHFVEQCKSNIKLITSIIELYIAHTQESANDAESS